MKRFQKAYMIGAIALLPVKGPTENSVNADDQINIVDAREIEQIRKLVASDIKENIWSNLLSVADQSFSGDNQQLNLDFQDDVYRLNFDLGTNNTVKANSERAVFTTFTLNGSVPLSGNRTRSQLPTLNELANGSTLKFAFSRTIVPFAQEYWTPEKINLWTTNLKPLAISAIISGTASEACFDRVSSQYYLMTQDDIKVANNTPADARIAVLKSLISSGDIPATTDRINGMSIDRLVGTDKWVAISCLPKSASRNFWAPTDGRKKEWTKTFGATATIGQEDFSYTNAVTFNAESVTETTYAFGVFARFERGSDLGGSSISAAVDLQHAFLENEMSTMCRDPEDMDSCLEAVFGPPQAQDSFIAKASYTNVLKDLTLFGSRPIAFSLNANYNIDEDIWGLEAPVFLYRDNNNLGAGLRAGWRSDTDNFEVGFFVSQKFSLN